jgi:hypothetical protein
MKRAWAAAIVALAALGIGIGIAVSDGSGPAGPAVAYVTGGAGSVPEVWLTSVGGGAGRRLGNGTQPLLSPNGSLVAASAAASGGAALILYSASGGATHRYFNRAAATASAQAWSPNSRYLAVALSSADPSSDAASGLAVIDTKTYASRIVARGHIYGASFASDGSNRIAYASAASMELSARVNVHVVHADGSASVQITHDGRSLNPVWSGGGIAFDRERIRIRAEPEYQVWVMSPQGAGRRQVTHLPIPPLLEGLVPIGFSSDGARLLAQYQGQDTSQAWVITPATGVARRLAIGGRAVTGAAISRDGTEALVDLGGYLNPPDAGAVESLPLAGGDPRVLIAHGSQPSWNL